MTLGAIILNDAANPMLPQTESCNGELLFE